MNITNYIQERIKKLEHDIETGTGWQSTKARYGIFELQAVLSKIEELKSPGHTETVKEVYPDGSFEVYTASEEPSKS